MTIKLKASLSLLSLAFLISIFVTAALAADSPQYIQSIYAVDASGNSLTRIEPTVFLANNKATITVAITTQIPSEVVITNYKFSCYADGEPRVGLDSAEGPTLTVQNTNGSITRKFTVHFSVPNEVESLTANLTYSVETIDTVGQPPVLHESAPLQFSISSSPNPTSQPTVDSSPNPTSKPIVEPTESSSPVPTSIDGMVKPTETNSSNPNVDWILPVAVGLVVATVLAIIVMVIYRRRK